MDYRYRVVQYAGEGRLEDVYWHTIGMQDGIKTYDTARKFFDYYSDCTAESDPRNTCIISQPRRNEVQALNQHASSMHAETWEVHQGDKKSLYHLALYVIKAA